MYKELQLPLDLEGGYIGPELEKGAFPAFFYFSLSAKDSLTLAPYNQPAQFLSHYPMRIFSFTLPFHEQGRDKFQAIAHWAEAIEHEQYILEEFIGKALESISWLIEKGYVDAHKIAVGGLSRGGFIATHIAAREKRVETLLGFAPLTRLQELKEFKIYADNSRFQSHIESLELMSLLEQLTHVKYIRYYIGNRDITVSTDACYFFIRALAEKAHIKRSGNQIELFITQSIGHNGHGTSSLIFEEGALWLRQKIQ